MPDARFDSVRAVIQRLVDEEGVPSIAVAVAKDGVVLWQEGYGWADRERGIRATPHTSYSLASITKPITSTAIMALSERGQLDLDAPIESYLGGIQLRGLAGDTREVTPRRIMAHSAGLPTHFRGYFADDELPSPEQMLSRYGIVVFPPGVRWEYSNVGYRALDVAISNLSGRSFGEFLHREIFVPLGMNRSAVDLDPARACEAATRYDGGQNPIPHYVTDHPGSGDVWSSAHDMLRFGMFHLGTLPGQPRLLRQETIAAMQQIASAPGPDWGLGWQLAVDRGYRVVRHGGGQPGVSTQLTLYPDEGLAIVVLSNREQTPVWDIAEQIAAAVLPREIEASGAATAGNIPRSPVDFLGRWVGTVTTYEGTEPFALDFQADGDIHVSLGTRFITSLVRNRRVSADALTGWFYGVLNTSDALPHRHNVSFALMPDGGELIGQLTARGIDASFAISSFVRLRRLDEALLEEYVGVYRHEEGADRAIIREGERLYSQRGSGTRYELNPIGEDLFLMVGTGGSVLRFERENGRVTEVVWQQRDRGRRVG